MIRGIGKLLRLMNKSEKKRMLMLILVLLFGAMLESLGVSVVLPLVQAVTNPEAKILVLMKQVLHIESTTLLIQLLLVAIALIYILKALYIIMENHFMYRFAAKVRIRIQNEIMSYYLSRPYIYYRTADSGSIVRMITSDTVNLLSMINGVLHFFTEVLVVVLITGVVILVDPLMMAAMAAAMALEFILVMKLLKPAMNRQGKVFRNRMADVNNLVLQAINGIKSIKVGDYEAFFEEKVRVRSTNMAHAERRYQTLNVIPKVAIEAATMTSMMVYLLIAMGFGVQLETLIPVISVCIMAALRLLPCINRISTAVSNTMYREPSVDGILELYQQMERKPQAMFPEASAKASTEGSDDAPVVAFRKVSYRYPDGDTYILKDADWSIHRGETVGVMGVSGSGKTTTIDILLGILTPESGEILGSGRNIGDDIAAWHQKIAYIPQDIFMLNDTVRANVAFGIPEEEIDDAKVWEALERAQMKDYIQEQPEGLDTPMLENGSRFSGGQRQRIGIARALYRNSELLIFDEATSALDVDTEQSVMKAIDSLNGIKTIIMIAHRTETLKNCKKIYQVMDGKIIEKE